MSARLFTGSINPNQSDQSEFLFDASSIYASLAELSSIQEWLGKRTPPGKYEEKAKASWRSEVVLMGSTFSVAGSGAIAQRVVAGFHVGTMVLGLNSAFARAPHAEAQTLVEDNVRGFRG